MVRWQHACVCQHHQHGPGQGHRSGEGLNLLLCMACCAWPPSASCQGGHCPGTSPVTVPAARNTAHLRLSQRPGAASLWLVDSESSAMWPRSTRTACFCAWAYRLWNSACVRVMEGLGVTVHESRAFRAAGRKRHIRLLCCSHQCTRHQKDATSSTEWHSEG